MPLRRYKAVAFANNNGVTLSDDAVPAAKPP
jgi:hypothetical protein